MSKQLEGQVALVTGAGLGIGRALGATGVHVVVAARTRSEIEAIAGEIGAAGGRSLARPVDLSSEAEIIALFEFIIRKRVKVGG